MQNSLLKIKDETFFVFSDSWGCPVGYLLMGELCYKYFRQNLTYSLAERQCTKDGGQLAEPITFLQVNPHYHNLTKCFTSK
jgi:hypothetical protein